ncbi:MAG: hypothetical protein GY909_06555 [Oligoflexia bacterium]|nr:hypothetical protein [Oligoflexia bacterium]
MKILLFAILFLFSCHQEKPKPKVKVIPFTKEEIKEIRNKFFHDTDPINIYLVSNSRDRIDKSVSKIVTKMKNEYAFSSNRIFHLTHSKMSYENIDEIVRLFELPQKSYIYFFLKFDNHEKQIKAFERLKILKHRPFLIPMANKSEKELTEYLIQAHLQNRLVPFE